MTDDSSKLTLTLPRWQVDLADQLVGCVFFEPHSKPGLINHIHLHNRSTAFAHLAGRGVAHVEATIREQITRERRDLEGWRTIRRFFAQNRQELFFKRSDLGPDDHAALAIMTAWSDDEDDEGMPKAEAGFSLEALEASLPCLERAADSLKHARSKHVQIAAIA